uniref:Uncharacterized protein n=1 Tax=Timema cristinae TaxID=61476 RepID=A0A7R9H5T6_TIMCR|nr:unnamed protein product [Timema cristinae]
MGQVAGQSNGVSNVDSDTSSQYSVSQILHTGVTAYGSLTQSSTWRLGSGPAGESVYVPMWELLPMVSPDNLVIDGWDINGADLATAMTRAQVLDWGLQQQLKPHMEQFKPRASVFNPDFIAANQVQVLNMLHTK